jgi:hypothetical protein
MNMVVSLSHLYYPHKIVIIYYLLLKEERNKNAETGNINSNFKRKDIYLSLNDTKEYRKNI